MLSMLIIVLILFSLLSFSQNGQETPNENFLHTPTFTDYQTLDFKVTLTIAL